MSLILTTFWCVSTRFESFVFCLPCLASSSELPASASPCLGNYAAASASPRPRSPTASSSRKLPRAHHWQLLSNVWGSRKIMTKLESRCDSPKKKLWPPGLDIRRRTVAMGRRLSWTSNSPPTVSFPGPAVQKSVTRASIWYFKTTQGAPSCECCHTWLRMCCPSKVINWNSFSVPFGRTPRLFEWTDPSPPPINYAISNRFPSKITTTVSFIASSSALVLHSKSPLANFGWSAVSNPLGERVTRCGHCTYPAKAIHRHGRLVDSVVSASVCKRNIIPCQKKLNDAQFRHLGFLKTRTSVSGRPYKAQSDRAT
jgi:hypothetical protein